VRVDLSGAFAALLVAAAASAALAGTGARTWAAGGLVYAGLLILAVISLRFSFPFGDRAIVWLFATVWSTDVFAYFGGRIIGGPKLWPRVSPSKTWSGTITGLAAGAALGTVVALRHLESPHALVPVLLLSVAAAALSQAGDAFESGIKRRFGVKDTSRLIPGHGGLMDRLDGFIAAAIFAFLIGLVRGLPSVAGGLFYWA
jgi:phosphatidate cytidylyltransferase